MVPAKDEYRFVVGANADTDFPFGDLDRIVCDGGVMPLRTGNTGSVDRNGDPIPRKNILRGEDICFLLEAYTERLHLLNFKPRIEIPQGIPNRVFRRRLDWNTIGGTDDPKGLIEGFDILGNTGNLWVPETGRPQTGSYEAPFTLSDAWPGLLLWPERKPMRSQDWMPVSRNPPWNPPGWDVEEKRLLRSRIEAMFENLKLMTSVSCQVCDADTFSSDSRFTSVSTYERYNRHGDPIPSSVTRSESAGFRVFYGYYGTNGYYAVGGDSILGNYSNSLSLKSGGSAVVASNLPQGAKLTPVYVARGIAYMDESLWDGAYIDPESGDPPPRGRFLDKNLYYCLVGGTVTVPATGEFTIEVETLNNLGSRLRGALAVDESFSVGVDNTYHREYYVSCTLQEVHLIVTLGDHTRWWES